MSESRKKAFPKTDARYWEAPGKLVLDPRSKFYVLKLQVSGRRESFPLRSPLKETAAAKAAGIFRDVVSMGWDDALQKHKPEPEKKVKSGTVGDLIRQVAATSSYRSSTFTAYCQALRQIAAEIREIGDQPALDDNGEPKRDKRKRIIYLSRLDRLTGGNAAWVEKVAAVPLDALTAAAVQRWRIAYVANAGDAPDARRNAENTASSLIRNARALFSDKALKFCREALALPDPLPFAGIKLPKKGNTKYKSKLDAATIIAAAGKELTGEPYKIFTLGMLVGLRKREIDLLACSQVDEARSQIRIERTEWFDPKSEDSIAVIDVDPELMALLIQWKQESTGGFIVNSKKLPRANPGKQFYRCSKHFGALYAWLRSKGIAVGKPLHELRKELGSILANEQGIFAAQAVLRHAHIATTAAYYTDKKRTITAGLGKLLASQVKEVEA